MLLFAKQNKKTDTFEKGIQRIKCLPDFDKHPDVSIIYHSTIYI